MTALVTVYAYVAKVERRGRTFVSDPAPTAADAQIMCDLLAKRGHSASVCYVECGFGTEAVFVAWQDQWCQS